MKLKSLKSRIILSVVNLLCIAGAVTFSIISCSQINSLTSQRGAEKWRNNKSDMDYSQVSCFFSRDSGADTNTVNAVRSKIKSAMTGASLKEEDNKRLWIDTYTSSLGKMEVSGTKRGTARTEITAVTSDFFLIHDFKFTDGSYFRDDELSENGIVIDRSLAWQIFGSDEVKGMNAEISGFDFYVAGVVEAPECSAEKKTYGELPRAYISYGSAESLLKTDEEIPVESYEAVVPNPVENFAYNTISEFVEDEYENTSVTVENSSRFKLLNNFRRLKHLSNSVIITNSVQYTWWENSARVTEVKASLNLFAVIVFLIIPFLTLAMLFIKVIKYIYSRHPFKKLAGKIKEKVPY